MDLLAWLLTLYLTRLALVKVQVRLGVNYIRFSFFDKMASRQNEVAPKVITIVIERPLLNDTVTAVSQT
jgi:hypothetical protein